LNAGNCVITEDKYKLQLASLVVLEDTS